MAAKRRKKNQKKKEELTVSQVLDIVLTDAMALFSCIWIFLILVVMPLYFQEGYVHIGSDKSYLLRSGGVRLGKIMLPVFGLWAGNRIRNVVSQRHAAGEKFFQKDDLARISTMDVCAVLFAIGTVISYMCSEYRENALWGTRGWYMGMYTQLILVVSFLVISRFEFSITERWLLIPAFLVSAVTFVLGYLNRFDIWPLKMESSGLPIYISTVGNINWFCSYILAVLFTAVGLFWLGQEEKKSRMVLWGIYLFMGFASLITQGSDSGIFAMLVILLFLFCRSLYARDCVRLRRFWQMILLLGGSGIFTWLLQAVFSQKMNFELGLGDVFCGPFSLAVSAVGIGGIVFTDLLIKKGGRPKGKPDIMQVLAIVLAGGTVIGGVILVLLIGINTLHPGSIGGLSKFGIFTFNHEWGSRRGTTWPLGIRCFIGQNFLHKLVGVGPDCMVEYLYSEQGIAAGLAGVADQVFEGMRLTNAHCELLTMLVNEGLLGAVSYGGMILALLRANLFRRLQDLNPVAAACALGVMAAAINNIWSFQQAIGTATLFVLMGLGRYYEGVGKAGSKAEKQKDGRKSR